MKEVPKMISTKDLSYLEDAMNWNMVYSKKSRLYKGLVKNKEIKTFLNDVMIMHTSHYQKLLKILEGM